MREEEWCCERAVEEISRQRDVGPGVEPKLQDPAERELPCMSWHDAGYDTEPGMGSQNREWDETQKNGIPVSVPAHGATYFPKSFPREKPAAFFDLKKKKRNVRKRRIGRYCGCTDQWHGVWFCEWQVGRMECGTEQIQKIRSQFLFILFYLETESIPDTRKQMVNWRRHTVMPRCGSPGLDHTTRWYSLHCPWLDWISVFICVCVWAGGLNWLWATVSQDFGQKAVLLWAVIPCLDPVNAARWVQTEDRHLLSSAAFQLCHQLCVCRDLWPCCKDHNWNRGRGFSSVTEDLSVDKWNGTVSQLAFNSMHSLKNKDLTFFISYQYGQQSDFFAQFLECFWFVAAVVEPTTLLLKACFHWATETFQEIMYQYFIQCIVDKRRKV